MADTLTTGTVALTNSSSSSAMFTVGNRAPGDGGQRCVTVNYTGNVDAGIKLYGTATGAPRVASGAGRSGEHDGGGP